MLRIHFTERDLARVQVATAADPLWETILALQQLVAPCRSASEFAQWRRRARSELMVRQLQRPARLLHILAPAGVPYFPDFLTPAAAAEGIEAGLDALQATPRARLHQELVRHVGAREPQGWVRQLASGDARRLAEIADAFRLLHRTVIAPEWSSVGESIEADRALRARALRDGGLTGLLGSLRPWARWKPPVLEIDYPESRDVHLAGRGLRLVPSFFCWRLPVSLADPELPPVLVYPVERASVRAVDGPPPKTLASLLGRTRARVLACLGDSATTGELAQRLRISAPSASEHVRVLRESRLVRSTRHGNRVVHTLTPLGAALLRSGRVNGCEAVRG